MRHFTVAYNSFGNLFEGSMIVSANTLADAQTLFFEWLKKQSTYNHLWRLEFEFKEYKILYIDANLV